MTESTLVKGTTMPNIDAASPAFDPPDKGYDSDSANAFGPDRHDAIYAIVTDVDKHNWMVGQGLIMTLALRLFERTLRFEFLEVADKALARIEAILEAEAEREGRAKARLDLKGDDD